MKLKLSDSFSIVLVALVVGFILSNSAEAFPQTAKPLPVQVDAPANDAVHLPSPLSAMDDNREPPKHHSYQIPANQFVTYEIDLQETLLGYSQQNKCSVNEAFLKLANQLDMSPLETFDAKSSVEANPRAGAFYKLVGDNVYAISAKQEFFNGLELKLSNFRYDNKKIVIDVRFLDVPQSHVTMLQTFTIPGTFEIRGNQLPVSRSFANSGTFANQRDAETSPMSELASTNSANQTYVRGTETRTKAYPTLIGRVDDGGKEKLIKLVKSHSAMSIAETLSVIMLPKQLASVRSYSSRPFVVSVNEISDGTATSHQPVIQVLEDGVKIAIRTELLEDKLKLSGDLAFAKILGVETFNYPTAQTPDGDYSGVTIQIPEHQIRKVQWSAEVAANQSILIDAVETFEAEVKAKTRFKPAKTKTMRRLVLITPRVVVEKEVLANEHHPQILSR